MDLLFFDTTSTCFEVEEADLAAARDWRGEPTETSTDGDGDGDGDGEPKMAGFRTWGKSKDSRGDLPQIVIGMAVTHEGIPCPSAADPQRNAHRSGRAWTLGAVRTILANPRYTGRQVWNRQPSAFDLIDPANTGLGHRHTHRRIQPDGWVISTRPAHTALVSEADFIAAQNIRAPRGNPQPDRCYQLAGLLRCGICGRRMESCWANNRAAYRCRHGNTSASASDTARPKNLYIREDRVLAHLPA